MAKQSARQKRVVERVMHAFKEGELRRGQGGTVQNPRQAVAIALSEAGASSQASPQRNRARLRQAEQRQRTDEADDARPAATRTELYRRARQAGIQGRSRMTRDELQQALSRRDA